MTPRFHLFGPTHLLILASVPSGAALLTYWCRGKAGKAPWVRYSLAAFLTVNEVIWYAFRYSHEGFRFPEGLPLNLCDLTLWLTVLAACTLRPAVFELAYFAGIGGSGMALATPDLWTPFPSYPAIYFFLAHGVVVTTILTLIWSRMAGLRPGSVWRAFGWLNAYAGVIGIFDAIFKTNYMYLCRRPVSTSLLDYLGPWPIYIAGAEVVTLVMFWLLWLPVDIAARRRRPGSG
jgi:hypothetical integral membrane protein (TIGR02206 family)